MRIARGLIRVVAATWLAAAAAAQTPSDDKVSTPLSPFTPSASSASCLVRIATGDERMNEDVLHALLGSQPVAGEARREALGAGASRWSIDETLEVIAPPSDTDDACLVRIGVDIDGPDVDRSAAAKLLEAMLPRLERALTAAGEARTAELSRRRDATREEVAQAEKRLEEVYARRRELCESAGQALLSREEILGQLAELESQARELELDSAARQARRTAVEAHLDQARKRLEERSTRNEIADELRRIVELREQELKRAQDLTSKGAESTSAVNEAQERLVMARIELQRYMQEQSAGTETLAQLNQELAEMSIAAAEHEARLKLLRERLAQIRERKLLELADRYETLVEIELPLAMDAFREAREALAQCEQRARSLRTPSVSPLGGK
jgi:hypothetical protein